MDQNRGRPRVADSAQRSCFNGSSARWPVWKYCRDMADETVKGPASYFPSIEKKYGKPISHWKSLLKKMKGAKHAEMVAMLKTDREMGHGHANAIVAHFRAENNL